MAATETAVKQIEIRATATGLNEARTQTAGLDQALNAVANTNDRLAASFEKYEAAQRDVIKAQEAHISLLGRGADVISRFGGAYLTAKDALREWRGDNDNSNKSLLESARNWALFGRAVQLALGVTIPFLRAFSLALTAITLPVQIIRKASDDFQALAQAAERSEALNIGVGFIKAFEKIAQSARLSEEAISKVLNTAVGFVRDEFGESNKLLRLLDDIEKKTNVNLGSKTFAVTPSNEEERIRFAVDAMGKLEAAGQRLAALKIADSLFGPDIAERLRSGQISFENITARVKEIAATDPIDQAKAERALALSRAINDAKQNISDALSVSVDLSGISVTIQSAWLQILNAISTVVGWLNKGLSYLNSWDAKLQAFLRTLGDNPFARALRGAANLGNTTLGLGGDNPLVVNVPGDRGRARPNALPPPAPSGSPAKAAADEYDRVVKRTEDAIRRQQELIATFGMSAGAAAKYRTELELSTAAERAGREMTLELASEIQDFGNQAAEAAEKLERLQKTKQVLNEIKDAGVSAFTSFAQAVASGVKPLEAMHSALKQLGSALLSGGIKNIASGNVIEGGIEAAVGFGISIFEGDREKQKARRQKQLEDAKRQADDANRKAEEIGRLTQSYLDRFFMAANAGDDLSSQLARFDYQTAKDRAEAARGGPQVSALAEQAFALERQRIIDNYNKQALDDTQQAAKDQLEAQQKLWDDAVGIVKDAGQTIKDYLTGLLTGADSPLSPGDRLAAAQSAFAGTLTAAQGGDRTALSSITRAADALLEAAKANFASSSGFQDIFRYVTSSLTGLQSSLDPSMFLPKFASGGLVGGSGGTDRNLALLTSGEFVMKPQAVQRIGLPQLQAMNDNPGNGMRSDLSTLVRVIANGTERQVRATAQVRDGVYQGNVDRRRAQQGGPGVSDRPGRRVAGRG